MRVPIIMLLIAAILFGVQSSYYRKQSGVNLVAAVRKLPADPEGGFKQMSDVFDYSNLMTFGLAAKTCDAFYMNVASKAAEAVRPSNKLDPGAFLVLRNNIRVLSDARKNAARNPRHKAEAALLKLLDEIRGIEPQMRESLRLPAWDAFVMALKDCKREGYVDPSLSSPGVASSAAAEFAAWADQVMAVDRRPIGLRTALEIGTESLAAGVAALGGAPYAPEPPLLFAMPAPPDSPALIEADKAFEAGKTALEQFPRSFPGAYPAAVDMIWAKITYNLGIMRVGHLQKEGQKLLSEASEYFAYIFIKPNTEVVPSEAEMYGAFVNAASGNVDQAAALFEKLATAGEPDAAVLTAVARQGGVQFARVQGRPSAAGPFEAARAKMLGSPGGAEWASLVTGGDGLVLVVK